jgi:hypothetical protein
MGFSASIGLENEFNDRFWFWNGASGKRYIHSVYHVDNCPPLPGAIYVLVRRLEAGTRLPLRMGRFSLLWDFPLPNDFADEACEIHVHLLAGSDADAALAYDDLEAGLELDENRDITEARPSAPSHASGFTDPALPLFAGIAA